MPYLSIVLHTHMPYVEGYGTWPFGEEWLWEAMATSYLPLLDVLDDAPELTVSLTPVLADQLAVPGLGGRFERFLAEVREETHRRDAEAARRDGDEGVAAELERAAGEYRRAGERFEAIGGDLLGALAAHAAWTSSATHAVLPLCASDAGVRLQLRAGVEAHRRRVERPWRGGLWLPECAYAPWLDRLLEEAGVRAACVDLTDVLGRGTPEQLRPLASAAGPVLVPIDREIVELVWSPGGYPVRAAYRDSHRRTRFEHRPWRNDGAVYDPAAAEAQAAADAGDFVERVERRLQGGGLCVCALDTELLGHWWHEGVAWLAAVVAECRRRGVALVHLDDALERIDAAPVPVRGLPVTTWGDGRDLSTWSGPAVADLAWSARDAELRALSAGRRTGDVAVRELLALQSSDWAFAVSRRVAEPYGRQRAALHRERFDAALAGRPVDDGPRGLAPFAGPEPLLEP